MFYTVYNNLFFKKCTVVTQEGNKYSTAGPGAAICSWMLATCKFFSVLVAVYNLAIFTLGEMDWGQTHIPLFHSEISYLKTSYPRFEIPFSVCLKNIYSLHCHFPETHRTWLMLPSPWSFSHLTQRPGPHIIALDPSAPAQWHQAGSPASHSPAQLGSPAGPWPIPVPREVSGVRSGAALLWDGSGEGWDCLASPWWITSTFHPPDTACMERCFLLLSTV